MCYPASRSLGMVFIEPFYYVERFAKGTSRSKKVFCEEVGFVDAPRLRRERFKNGLAAISLAIPVVGIVALAILHGSRQTKQVAISKIAKALQDPKYKTLEFQFYLKRLIEEDQRSRFNGYESLIQELKDQLKTLRNSLDDRPILKNIETFSNKLRESAREFIESHFHRELGCLDEEEKHQVISALRCEVLKVANEAQVSIGEYQLIQRKTDQFLNDFQIETIKFSNIQQYLSDQSILPNHVLNRLILRKFIFKLSSLKKGSNHELYSAKKQQFFKKKPMEFLNRQIEVVRNNPEEFSILEGALELIDDFIFDIFDCDDLLEEDIKIIKNLVFTDFFDLEEKVRKLNQEINEVLQIIAERYLRSSQPKSLKELREVITNEIKIENLSGAGFQSLIENEFEQLSTPNYSRSRFLKESSRSGSNAILRQVLDPTRGSSVCSSCQSVSFSDPLFLGPGSHYSDGSSDSE